MSEARRLRHLIGPLFVLFMVIFVAGGLPWLARKAHVGPAPPLPVPESAPGQYVEKAHPELNISVDVRDGHLTVRVVDDWGPGKTPLLYRTYSNTAPDDRSAAGVWHLNQILELRNTASTVQVREADGTLSLHTFSGTRTDATGTYYVYTKSNGIPSTIETREPVRARCRPEDCDPPTWNGVYVQYLPKGMTRQFIGAPTVDTPPSWAGIVEERDANGNTRTYTWGELAPGRRAYLSSVTDEVGRVTTYAYELSVSCRPDEPELCRWRVKTITDPYGRTVTFTYDANRALVQVQNAAGALTHYGGNLVAYITYGSGQFYRFTWALDVYDRIERVTAPDDTFTTYAYNTPAAGQTTVTNARGGQHVYRHEPDGRILSITDPSSATTSYEYDARQNVTKVIDARGTQTVYEYNAQNLVTKITLDAATLALASLFAWDGNGNLLSVTTPRGITHGYEYDARHNLTRVILGRGTAEEAVTQYTYTPWGGVASELDPRGNPTLFDYDARRRLTRVAPPVGGATTFGYDAVDDRTSMLDGNGRTWTYTFNLLRLPLTVTDPLTNRTTSEYDTLGHRTRVTDPKVQSATFGYDTRDRLTLITDPLNGQTRYAYDAVGNLTQITNALTFPTTFAYDPAGRLTRVTDALAQITQYGYDGVGNRTSMTDRKGQAFTYAYDRLNRLSQVSAPGQTLLYTYDPNSNRLTMTDPTGTTTYAWDALDRWGKTTYPDGKDVQASYDLAGNRTRLINPVGIITAATYDAANRLTQITQPGRIWGFAYDGAGNRTSLTAPNGTSTTYAYLNNNWLASITHLGPGGVTLQSAAYTYDPNGNRLTQTDPSGTTNFTYDALNRLTQAAHPETYGTWGWTYDAVGNRTQQIAPTATTTYAYDRNNRLTEAGGTLYSYDPNGNLTQIAGSSIGSVQTLTYDPFNRLTQMVTGAGGVVTYAYNGDGLKVRRVAPDGAQTNYYYDGIRPIWETDGVGGMTAQLDRDIFGNLLARTEAGGAQRYYHPDGLGSTTALTDELGAVSATMLYDAWGNVRANSGDAPGKYRFTGAELDETTGLYHMGARFYDAAVGRWLSEDPVQDKHFEPATLNFYAYAYNRPSVLIDDDGKEPCAIFSLGIDVFGAGGGCGGGGSGGGALGPAGGAGSTILARIAERGGGATAILGWVLDRGGRLFAWVEAKGLAHASKHMDQIARYIQQSMNKDKLTEMMLRAGELVAQGQGTLIDVRQDGSRGYNVTLYGRLFRVVIDAAGAIFNLYPL